MEGRKGEIEGQEIIKDLKKMLLSKMKIVFSWVFMYNKIHFLFIRR